MTITALSKTAAAVALTLASLGAHATAVVINFESLKDQVLGNPPTTPAAPLAVGSLVNNFALTGAWAYAYAMLERGVFSNDPVPSSQEPATGDVFIANKSRIDPSGVVALSWGGGDFRGWKLKSITFDLFVSAVTPFVYGLTSSGAQIAPRIFTPGDGKQAWILNQLVDFGDSSEVSELRFGATDGSASGVLGMDNLRLEWTSGSIGGGGTVPEPASFGLVALALLGAGVASRRRKPA